MKNLYIDIAKGCAIVYLLPFRKYFKYKGIRTFKEGQVYLLINLSISVYDKYACTWLKTNILLDCTQPFWVDFVTDDTTDNTANDGANEQSYGKKIDYLLNVHWQGRYFYAVSIR